METRVQAVRVCLALVTLAAVGCGTQTEVGSRYVKSVLVEARAFALIEVAAHESPELAGASLAIPAGVLVERALVTVEPTFTDVSDATMIGPGVLWGPASADLSGLVTMTLPVTTAVSNPGEVGVVMKGLDGVLLEAPSQSVTVGDGRASVAFQTAGLWGAAQVVRRAPCSVSTDCGSGTCRDGFCEGPLVNTCAGTCVDGVCNPLTRRCEPVAPLMCPRSCDLGMECDQRLGQCVMPDGGVTCPACVHPQQCDVRAGVCVNRCRLITCPTTAVCDDSTGQCMPARPDAGTRCNPSCPAGAVCDEQTALCVRADAGMCPNCPSGTKCNVQTLRCDRLDAGP